MPNPIRSSVDLHTHTTASDGALTPTELVREALDRGLVVLAITDHDSTSGVDEGIAAAENTTLEVWSGVEISTDVPRAEVHLLGYFVDQHDESFQRTLQALRDGREDRAQRMVEKLNALGMPLDWDRVVELAGAGSIGRPHVAQAMYEQGYVRSISEAFDLYLGRNAPAYVERYKLTPVEAARLVISAGGLPVLAHPVIVESPETAAAISANPSLPEHIKEALPDLVQAGLVGIEAYYSDYPAALTDYLVHLADQLGLVATGGSDYHGRGLLSTELGSVYVPLESAHKLKQLRSQAR